MAEGWLKILRLVSFGQLEASEMRGGPAERETVCF